MNGNDLWGTIMDGSDFWSILLGMIAGAFVSTLIWLAAIDSNYCKIIETVEAGIYLEYQNKLYYAEKVVK